MKVVIAVDSFKGSLKSNEVSKAIEKGFKSIIKDSDINIIPIADGGEGTVECLVEGTNGQYFYETVKDPLGRIIISKYGVISNDTVIIDSASASGITLLNTEELDPTRTSTYGTGQLIKSALDRGFKHIFIGLGGSATNDGGVGMAQALGISFLDENGKEIGPGGGNLDKIKKIDISNRHPSLDFAEITGLTDVNNTFCGINGASLVYGPQKGATLEVALELDKKMLEFSGLINEQLGVNINEIAGSGAAGGMAGGLIGFCNAKLIPGIDAILEILEFKKTVQNVDLVITGEGKIDKQSKFGKVPIGVAKVAKQYGKPVIAIVGSQEYDIDEIYELGIDLVLDIINKPMDITAAFTNAEKLAVEAGKCSARVWSLNSSKAVNL